MARGSSVQCNANGLLFGTRKSQKIEQQDKIEQSVSNREIMSLIKRYPKSFPYDAKEKDNDHEKEDEEYMDVVFESKPLRNERKNRTVQSAIVFDRSKQKFLALMYCTDVSALQPSYSETYFAALVDNVPTISGASKVFTDLDTAIKQANHRYLQYTKEEIYGKWFADDSVHLITREEVVAAVIERAKKD